MQTTASFKDLTEYFEAMYYPTSALVFYQSKQKINTECYTEFVHLDSNGTPLSSQPLSVEQAQTLARMLVVKKEEKQHFLQSNGLLPANVLYIHTAENGYAIWYSKAQRRKLFFEKSLAIENTEIAIPPLVWKAYKDKLFVYALAQNRKPSLKTALYYAPFFNVYENGNVCMGSVQIQIKKNIHLEEFIHLWETYFFNSYFSHQLENYRIIKGKYDLKSLWQKLSITQKTFPIKILQPNQKLLKNIL